MNMHGLLSLIVIGFYTFGAHGMEPDDLESWREARWVKQICKLSERDPEEFGSDDKPEVYALAENFIRKMINRSETPIIFKWNPMTESEEPVSDIYWKYASLLDREKEKVKYTGHASIAWMHDGAIHYASFWPSRRSSRQGVWNTFAKDIEIEDKCPDAITTLKDSKVFCGKLIIGWDIPALTHCFETLEASGAEFDIKGREGKYSCASIVYKLIRAGIQLERPTTVLLKQYPLYSLFFYFSTQQQSGSKILVKAYVNSIVTALITTSLLVVAPISELTIAASKIEQKLRDGRGLTPNYIFKLFDSLFYSMLKAMYQDTKSEYLRYESYFLRSKIGDQLLKFKSLIVELLTEGQIAELKTCFVESTIDDQIRGGIVADEEA